MTKEQIIDLLNKVKVLKSKAKKCYGYDRKIQDLLNYIIQIIEFKLIYEEFVTIKGIF